VRKWGERDKKWLNAVRRTESSANHEGGRKRNEG